MSMEPHKVALVVDKEFGEKLISLSKRIHVWVCDSETNMQIIKKIWASTNSVSLESGITSFKFSSHETSEDMVITNIDIIDEHHGDLSHDPAWSVLEVYGSIVTQRIKMKLKQYGEGQYKDISDGFKFCRN